MSNKAAFSRARAARGSVDHLSERNEKIAKRNAESASRITSDRVRAVLRMRAANVTFHCYGLYHWTLSTLVPAVSGPPLAAPGVNGSGLAMLATEASPAQAPRATGGEPTRSDAEAELSAGEWVDACFLRHSAPWVVGYCVAYTAVFVVGVVGNCCVLRVVSRNASMKNSAFHALLVNLAVADLMVIVFCLPVTLVGHLFGHRHGA
ncbi:hypothetical protein HPB48_002885 [Haemaphysalis longicornis]|uniref:G-protein coupled receptors family 1 profile domain-containing protein n=1 Tax=Haemaphysalis longicornis TaxID=44386 RepID=A0A9J6FE94_HAELO|nr:hypothetical protein HPB48_002885 [Haemaphysalis longicornis]